MRRELGMFGALVVHVPGALASPTATSSGSRTRSTRCARSRCSGIYAIGSGFVIITGGIDLSVGSVVGLTGVIIAKISSQATGGGWPFAGARHHRRAGGGAAHRPRARGCSSPGSSCSRSSSRWAGCCSFAASRRPSSRAARSASAPRRCSSSPTAGSSCTAAIRCSPTRCSSSWRWSPSAPTCCTSRCSAATSTPSAATATRPSTRASTSSGSRRIDLRHLGRPRRRGRHLLRRLHRPDVAAGRRRLRALRDRGGRARRLLAARRRGHRPRHRHRRRR